MFIHCAGPRNWATLEALCTLAAEISATDIQDAVLANLPHLFDARELVAEFNDEISASIETVIKMRKAMHLVFIFNKSIVRGSFF